MKELDYDIVIVGCGIAGLTAGLRASELDNSVAVLEKSPKKHRGGQTRFTESFRIPTADIDVDAEFNVKDYSTSDFYSDIMKVAHYRADEELAEAVTEESVGMFEWLTDTESNENTRRPIQAIRLVASGFMGKILSRNSSNCSKTLVAKYTITPKPAGLIVTIMETSSA